MKKRNLFLSVIALLTFAFSCSGNDDTKKEEEIKDPINNYFPGEVKPQAYFQCFPGAYYRKVVSSKDTWLGIGGKVILPQISFDPDRINPAKPKQYLDNPSLYLGGNANGQETDIGMTWEVIRDQNGTVTADRRAFRPFLRRTGYKGTGQEANYMNAPAEDRYYWYQGDEIEISLEVVRDGWILFTVEGAGKKYQQEYQCDGYKLNSKIEFKRVNAIDQVANEGKPAQPTKTKVENSLWKESYLFRMYNNELVKAPIHSGRFTDMRCPDVKYFSITASDEEKKKGGETINIDAGI